MNKTKEMLIAGYTLVAIIILVGGISYLKGITLFKNSNSYFASFSNASGLTESKPVYLSGFKIGRIDKLSLKQSGEVVAELKLLKDYKLPQNSVAQLASVDILGSKSIIIIPGDSDKYAKGGDTLSSFVQKGLAENFEPIQKNAQNVLENFDNVLININKTFNPGFRKNLSKTMGNMANVSSNLVSTTIVLNLRLKNTLDNLATTMKNMNKFSNQLKNSSKDFGVTMSNLSTITTSLKIAKTDSLVLSLRTMSNQLNTVLRKINSSQGSFGKLVNDSTLFVNLNATLKSMDSLFIDLKLNPKRYVHLSVFGRKNKK